MSHRIDHSLVRSPSVGFRCSTLMLAMAFAVAILAADLAAASAGAVDDFVWIGGHTQHEILKIQKSTNSVVATIPISGPFVFGVAVDLDSVWAGHYSSDAVSRISKTTDTVTTLIPIPRNVYAVAVDTDFAWITSAEVDFATGALDGSNLLSKISKTTNAVVGSLAFATQPYGVAVDQNSAWVARQDFVTRIDKATSGVVAEIPIVGSGRGIAANDHDFVWVADFDSMAILKISKASNSVVQSISTAPFNPYGIAVSPDSLWVTSYLDGTVLRIDKLTSAITQIPLFSGAFLHGISLDADSVWVDGFFNANVYRLSQSTNAIVSTLATGLPALATFGDSTGYLYDAVAATPATLITDLIAIVAALDFKRGLKLLERCLKKLDSGKTEAACRKLSAFKKKVAAQSGKKLTTQQAAQLTFSATQVETALSCP